MRQSKFHRDIQPLQGVKKWGIKIDRAWLTGQTTAGETEDMVYNMKREAQQDADAFNSIRRKSDNPYTVEEYKK